MSKFDQNIFHVPGLPDKKRKSLNNSKYTQPWLDNEYQQTFQMFLHWEEDSAVINYLNQNNSQTLSGENQGYL
jgi:hypothetical protein